MAVITTQQLGCFALASAPASALSTSTVQLYVSVCSGGQEAHEEVKGAG
jgi:hypothetical protein